MQPMNFLIVMADQLTPFALPRYGGQAIAPNLERLAEAGVVFDAAYSSSPLCAPARFAFMAGRQISRIGAWDNAAYLPSTTPTFAHYLRIMGYRTSLSGKMHFVGPDQLHGFEERLTTDVYPADFGWVPNWTRPEERIDLWYHNMSSVKQAGPAAITNQFAYDDEVGAASMRWLYDAARQADERPFCHVASFIHPHDPYAARQRYWNMYDGIEIAPPDTPRPDRDSVDPFSRRLEHAIALDAVDIDEDDIRRARRAYLANVTYVDEWLGRLLAVLEETGRRDDTAILFLSDHGDMLGERGLWYKMSPFEPSSRIPMLLSAPGLGGGRTVATPVSQLDVLPTLVELAASRGLALPEFIDPPDGASLAGDLDPDRTVAVEYTAEAANAPILTLRRRNMKYIASPIDPEQLYDLDEDPKELRNLAGQPTAKDAIATFRDAAAAHWNVDAVHRAVLESQRRRRILTEALTKGRLTSWDYQPPRDAAQEYTRSHMELSDFDYWSRWPRPPEYRPRWK